MNKTYFEILDAVEGHDKYDAKSDTTYYGVTSKAFDSYKKKNKDSISKKNISKLTKQEAAKVAEYYLGFLTDRLNNKTNNKFSDLDQSTKDGILMMAYNTGANGMPRTIQAINDDKNKYDIIDAMLYGEKNSSDKNLSDNKRGYLNRLYVSCKIIAGRNYEDLNSRKKLDKLYEQWKTIKETDLMRDCVKRINRDIYMENEQNFQLDNANETVINQKPAKSAQQSVLNTKQGYNTKIDEKPQKEGFFASLGRNVIDFISSFTNNKKNDNINTNKQENNK